MNRLCIPLAGFGYAYLQIVTYSVRKRFIISFNEIMEWRKKGKMVHSPNYWSGFFNLIFSKVKYEQL